MDNEEMSNEFIEILRGLTVLDLDYRIIKHYEKHYARYPSLKEYETAFNSIVKDIKYEERHFKRQKNS